MRKFYKKLKGQIQDYQAKNITLITNQVNATDQWYYSTTNGEAETVMSEWRNSGRYREIQKQQGLRT